MKKFLSLISFLFVSIFLFGTVEASTIVAYNATDVEFPTAGNIYCNKIFDSAYAVWKLSCLNTATSIGLIQGIIPPGLGNTFRVWAEYTTTDTGANEKCSIGISIYSTIGHCVGGSNAGASCRQDNIINCTGGGSCSGGADPSFSSYDFAGASSTLTHVSGLRYTMPYSAVATIQRNRNNHVDVNQTVPCIGQECNASIARMDVRLFYGSLTGTLSVCDFIKIWIEFI